MGGLSFFSEDMHNICMSACAEADELHDAACDADEYGPDGQLLNHAPGINYDNEDVDEKMTQSSDLGQVHFRYSIPCAACR